MASSSSSSPIGYLAPIVQTHLIGNFINPQPITKKGIVYHNPRMIHIYHTKRGSEPVFIAVAENVVGVAIKTIYEKESANPDKAPRCYLGKLGSSRGLLANDSGTYRTITKKKINFETMLEKLAYDLYQELGRGLIQVPKTYLSRQPILDTFTKTRFKALVLAGTPQNFIEAGLNPTEALPPEYRLSNESIRVMSRYYTADEYLDFTKAVTRDSEGVLVSFVDFIKRYHRPPTELRSPSGNSVPLRGFIALLAVGRVLADTDLLGGTGDNAGFTWVRDVAGNIIAAETVKIDPGMAFQFETEHNWAYNTHHRRSGLRHLGDSLNIQIANNDDSVTIHWHSLNLEQKTEFLEVLFNSSRYLNIPDVLDLLFYRDGRFNRSEVEQIPKEVANRYRNQMVNWLGLQLEIYAVELTQFKQNYPTQMIRAHYIDHWGELPLPGSDETFPIRELFTQLTLIEIGEKRAVPNEAKGQGEQVSPSLDPELPERDSLFETFQRMDQSGKEIFLQDLFADASKMQRLRKVLLIGRAGIGKSTLCQKIAHDWGSGRLWNDCYRKVYWLPLRELNGLVEERGALQGKAGDLWLAEVVARLILKDVDLTPTVLEQIQADRQTTLILLDGYDEASPRLAQALTAILNDPELTVLLTSRPGFTQHLHHQMDRLVENIGFSEAHIERYLDHFFLRKGELSPSALDCYSLTPLADQKETLLETGIRKLNAIVDGIPINVLRHWRDEFISVMKPSLAIVFDTPELIVQYGEARFSFMRALEKLYTFSIDNLEPLDWNTLSEDRKNRVIEISGHSEEEFERFLDYFKEKHSEQLEHYLSMHFGELIERFIDSLFISPKEFNPPSLALSFLMPLMGGKDTFLKMIRADVNLSVVAHIPLQLQMLAILWERGGEHAGFPSTLIGLYGEMVEYLFAWQLRRSGKDPFGIRGVGKTNLFVLLGRIGHVALESGRLMIPNSLVRPILDESLFSERDLLDSGLIRAVGQGVAREYCFLHLTFQEYLIAYSISKKGEEERNRWILDYRYQPRFELVIAFLAGMVHCSDSPDLIKTKDFFEVLYTPPGDCGGYYQIALTLRCLNECQSSELEKWIEERFCFFKDQPLFEDVFSYPKVFVDIKRKLIAKVISKDGVVKSFESMWCRIQDSSWGDPVLLDLLVDYVTENIRFIGNPEVRVRLFDLIGKHFNKLNHNQLERLNNGLPGWYSSSMRRASGMGDALVEFNQGNLMENPILVLEKKFWAKLSLDKTLHFLKRHIFGECIYSGNIGVLFKQSPKCSRFVLDYFKNTRLDNYEYGCLDENIVEALCSNLIKSIDQLSDSFLEEFTASMIDQLTCGFFKFSEGLFRYRLWGESKVEKFLALSIPKLSPPRISELKDKLLEALDRGIGNNLRRCITGILNGLIEKTSADEASGVISHFTSSLNSREWDLRGVDVHFLIKLLSDDQMFSLIDRVLSSTINDPYKEENRYIMSSNWWSVVLENLKKNSPSRIIELVCKYYRSFMDSKCCVKESVLRELIHGMAPHMTAPTCEMFTEEFLEENERNKAIRMGCLVAAATDVDSTFYSPRLPVNFLTNVVEPFINLWKGQLIYWQEQLKNSPDKLDFRLYGARSNVYCDWSYWIALMVRVSPSLYTKFIDFLCDYMISCSLENLRLVDGLIPPWEVFTPEQIEQFINSYFSRFDLTESEVLCDKISDLIVRRPEIVPPKLVEMLLNPRFRLRNGNSAHSALLAKGIPIQTILNADDPLTGRKYEVLVRRLIRNKVRLHLFNHRGTPVWCWIEDNQETRISYEHFCELQRRILVSHPLRTYIASYQPKSSVRDFTFFYCWLNQRIRDGWKISLSSDGERLFITREDRNLAHLRRLRGMLEDITENLSFKLDNKEGKLVIGGTAEEINQFLDWLKEDYNTSRPASSVPSEINSSS